MFSDSLSDIFADAEALERKVNNLEKSEGGKEQADKLKQLSTSVERIVLFVDDLDRCDDKKIAEVLQAVHLLLAFPLFAVVVGVDQHRLEQSLTVRFPGLLSPKNRRKGVRSIATPLDFLEKIFHIPFHLPPMEEEGFERLIHNLTPVVKESISREEISSFDTQASNANDESLENAVRTRAERPDVPPIESTRVVGSVPLEHWEREALKDYHELIRTPRGAKRFLNTYRLVRAGIPSEEWPSFRGDGATNGEFRLVMLLLAASAGYPAPCREWFELLKHADPHAIFMSEESRGSDPAAWRQFKKVFDATIEQTTPVTKDLFAKWLPQVERFAF